MILWNHFSNVWPWNLSDVPWKRPRSRPLNQTLTKLQTLNHMNIENPNVKNQMHKLLETIFPDKPEVYGPRTLSRGGSLFEPSLIGKPRKCKENILWQMFTLYNVWYGSQQLLPCIPSTFSLSKDETDWRSWVLRCLPQRMVWCYKPRCSTWLLQMGGKLRLSEWGLHQTW